MQLTIKEAFEKGFKYGVLDACQYEYSSVEDIEELSRKNPGEKIILCDCKTIELILDVDGVIDVIYQNLADYCCDNISGDYLHQSDYFNWMTKHKGLLEQFTTAVNSEFERDGTEFFTTTDFYIIGEANNATEI
jgi:hypothetical protein